MRGIWTALVTPFTSDNQVDLKALRRILQDQRDAGIDGVVACGTTGETPTLSTDEQKTVIKTALEELKSSKTKVYAGTGSNDTAKTVEMSRWASDAGVDGVLVVTPYYSKPTPSGLEAHFKAVADAIRCELMLYNIPGRSGIGMTPELIAKLASHPRIRSLKEATGSVLFTSEVIDALKARGQSNFDILSGDDGIFLPLLSVGAAGVVSVASNLFPRAMISIQKAYDSGDVAEAKRLHQHWYPMFRDLFVESNPGPIKAAMAHAGWCDARMRLPMDSMQPESLRKLEATLKRCGVERGRSL